MKKTNKLYTLILFTSLFCLSFVFDCYSNWLQALDNANAQYEANMSGCDGSMIDNAGCLDEADNAYNTAIETAGNEYIDC